MYSVFILVMYDVTKICICLVFGNLREYSALLNFYANFRFIFILTILYMNNLFVVYELLFISKVLIIQCF